jgi:hypothetical protein
MKLITHSIVPVLGALALLAAMPNPAEARSHSSFDLSFGLGFSDYGRHGGFYHSSGFRFSSGGGYYRSYRPYYYGGGPRYYSPRPIYRDYYYRPAPRYYYDDCRYDYYRTAYRPAVRYYYYNDDCD